MKHLFFILAFLPVAAFSQSSLGLKLGPSFSNSLTIHGSETYTGFIAGVTYAHNFRKLQITIEPSFIKKGIVDLFTDPYGVKSNSTKVKEIYNFIDIPIMFGYFSNHNKFRLGLNLGIAPSILLSGHTNSTNSNLNYTFDINKDNLRRFNLDFIIGGKVGYDLSDKIYIDLNIKYSVQLMTLYTNPGAGRLNYFTPFIEVGYKF